MSTPLQVSENIESQCINSKKDINLLEELVSLLEMHSQSIEHIKYRALANSIKTSIMQQQIKNRNCAIDGWKQYSYQSATNGRPKIYRDRDMLMCLISIGLKNAEIA